MKKRIYLHFAEILLGSKQYYQKQKHSKKKKKQKQRELDNSKSNNTYVSTINAFLKLLFVFWMPFKTHYHYHILMMFRKSEIKNFKEREKSANEK